MQSDHLNNLSIDVIDTLTSLHFDKEPIDELKRLQNTPSQNINLARLRCILEKIFKGVATYAHQFEGVEFKGSWACFGSIRDFLRSTSWLTESESRFVASYYALLSDAGSHGRQSYMDVDNATYSCWFIIDLLVYRMRNPKKKRRTVSVRSCVDDYKLARQFVWGLRKNKWKGRAFEVDFDRNLMQMTRELLQKPDTNLLFNLLENVHALPKLRNRAASLLLNNKVLNDRKYKATVIRRMRDYYNQNRDKAPWQVLRAVALALSNRANEAECILHYINKIKGNLELTEENLRISESYYTSKNDAVFYYINKLNDIEIPTAGCVWEIFYIANRASRGDRKVCNAIKECKKRTDNETIKHFCDNAIKQLGLDANCREHQQ
ncbi:hypothetical protein JXJ21_09035 [candidate division KSB1 bacterium]|nr:hypothetical protein [candidate division KSB1 bacterium]